MAAVTICSDFGAPQNKVSHCFDCFPIYHQMVNTKIRLGEGNGTPLQYCCLENPMDGGAWSRPVGPRAALARLPPAGPGASGAVCAVTPGAGRGSAVRSRSPDPGRCKENVSTGEIYRSFLAHTET